MSTGRGRKSRYWCFTVNNFVSTDEDEFKAAVPQHASYLVIGREVGDSGTPHLQGYIELNERKHITWCKNVLHGRAHFEARRGKAQQAADYCKKDGQFFEEGKISQSKQGHRTDLDEIKQEIEEGADELTIAENHFHKWIIYRRSFEAYRGLVHGPRLRPELAVFVLYGDAGTGKTRFVVEREPQLWISWDPTLKWFDGYRGEEAVLLDDYRGGADFSFLLRLLDIYPLRVPIKGGTCPFNAKRIYITSNLPPKDWHSVCDQSQAALLRRIGKTIHFGGFGGDWAGFSERTRALLPELEEEKGDS